MYARYKLNGFIGSYSGTSIIDANEKNLLITWFTNYNHKSLFYGKNIMNIYAWCPEKDIIKIYKKLPRKLKKKLGIYLKRIKPNYKRLKIKITPENFIKNNSIVYK